MPFRMNNAPRGFLQLFGMKNEGRNPGVMIDSVAPVAELSEFYLVESLGVTAPAATTVATPTASGTATFTQTPGFTYRILGVAGVVAVAAGDVAIDSIIDLAIVGPSGNTFPLTPGESTQSIIARQFGILFPHPLWIRPGFTLTATARLVSAPGSNWTVSIRVLSDAVPD
jgi:hypothetical protein